MKRNQAKARISEVLKKKKVSKETATATNGKELKNSDKTTLHPTVIEINAKKNSIFDWEDGKFLSSFLGNNESFSVKDFLDNVFQQRALVSHSTNGAKRFNKLIEEFLFDLDLKQLLEETSSEQIHVWMKEKGENGKFESFKIDSAESARVCHEVSGSGLYFRAPPDAEKALVGAASKELGINFAGVYQNDNKLKGEIEVFVSKIGNVTNFHHDFQWNFTFQLKGTKKWRLLPLEYKYPLRGATPHFKDQTTLETQSKIHTFNFSKPTFNVDPKACNNTPEITEVVLHAGDCFYFPAGMYHEVCCIDDEQSISINVSLIYTNYAELVTQGIYQLLLKDEKWRQGIDRVYSPNDLRQKLDNLLKTLKTDIGELKAEDFVPEKGLVDIVDKDNILRGKGIDESREKKAEKVIILTEENLKQKTSLKVSDSFRANPLAVLIPVVNDLGEKEPNLNKVDQQDILMDEDGDLLIPEDTEDRPEITEDMIKYVLHINWGNDEFESLIRVAFYLPGKAKTFVEELRKVLLTTDRNQTFNLSNVKDSNKYLALVQEFCLHGLLHKC